MRLVLLLLFVASTSWGKVATLEELQLPETSLAAIREDTPISDFSVVQNQSVIFLGQNCLWRWNIRVNEMRKLCRNRLFPNANTAESLTSFVLNGQKILITTDTKLLEFDPEVQSVTEFSAPLEPGESIRKILGQGDHIWLVTTARLYNVDRYGKKILPIKSKKGSVSSISARVFAEGPSGKLLWAAPLAEGDQIFLLDSSGGQLSEKLKDNVTAMGRGKENVLLAFRRAIGVYDSNLKQTRLIPVENNRLIAAASFQEGKHAFLFEDGICEVYDTLDGTRRSFDLSAFGLKGIKKMEAFSKNIVVLDERMIRVYAF